MYTCTTLERTVPLNEFIRDLVDVPRFLGCCQDCPHYGQVWSCPPYDFDPMALWRRYDAIHLYARKLIFTKDRLFPGEQPILGEDQLSGVQVDGVVPPPQRHGIEIIGRTGPHLSVVGAVLAAPQETGHVHQVPYKFVQGNGPLQRGAGVHLRFFHTPMLPWPGLFGNRILHASFSFTTLRFRASGAIIY